MYTGWLDYWGGGHAHGDTASIVATLKAIRDYNASSNMYVFIFWYLPMAADCISLMK